MTAMIFDRLVERTAKCFAQCFDKVPDHLAVAPGRVNVIGEHTDYNDGFVLPMAIEKYTALAGSRNNQRKATVHTVTLGETATIGLRGPVKRGEPAWSNYVRGVIAGFQRLGLDPGGFDAVIDSDVPVGGGLSSSAALEVATATLLEAMSGKKLDPVDKALLCQKAEHEYAGVPCGIMDQFTAVLAEKSHLLLLDCRSRRTKPVPFNDASLSVLTINTNVRHKLARSAYAQRRAQCEEAASILKIKALRDATLESLKTARNRLDPTVFRRARHVITENARTEQAARCFAAADWPQVGQLMYASHASLRDDYEVSCPELDAVVEIAREIGPKGGVFGCRMTGGGFGGCAVALVKTDLVEPIMRWMSEHYELRTKIIPALFVCRPADGARVV
jgi:galactokinase